VLDKCVIKVNILKEWNFFATIYFIYDNCIYYLFTILPTN